MFAGGVTFAFALAQVFREIVVAMSMRLNESSHLLNVLGFVSHLAGR